MNVYWVQQSEADMPSGDDWLSAAELSRLDGMRIPKRRADWRLGRWTAKCAIAAWLKQNGQSALRRGSDSLRSFEVRAQASGVPEPFVGGEKLALAMSLSHTSGLAMCAVARQPTLLGCDLEVVEPRSQAFVSDYFTADEQALIARASPQHNPLLSTLIWSAKESALKALGEGLRLDTRSVAVTASLQTLETCHTWQPLEVVSASGQIFHGWWQADERTVRTLVGNVVLREPLEMVVAAVPC